MIWDIKGGRGVDASANKFYLPRVVQGLILVFLISFTFSLFNSGLSVIFSIKTINLSLLFRTIIVVVVAAAAAMLLL